MADLTITHTHAEGTLIEGTAKGDGSNAVLKANRWRWGRSIGCWFIPHSRDKDAKTAQISVTVRELREAGFEVEVVIDDTARAAAEVEADKATRAEGRAGALEVQAQRKAAAAETAAARSDAAGHALPYGGEPIKVGHHSEARHRKAIETAHRRLSESVAADREATEADRRVEIAAAATDRRHSPGQVANRMAKLEAEIRATRRHLDGYTAERGTPYAHEVPAVTGATRERYLIQLGTQQDHLSYWQAVRSEQISSGQIREYTREQISTGDQIRTGGMWATVARANPKTVTVYLDASRGVVSSYRVPYAQIRDHHRAQS